jgi:hypothetical protein
MYPENVDLFCCAKLSFIVEYAISAVDASKAHEAHGREGTTGHRLKPALNAMMGRGAAMEEVYLETSQFVAPKEKSPLQSGLNHQLNMNGGGGRDRTGVNGFAGRCITTLLPRHGPYCNREIENTLQTIESAENVTTRFNEEAAAFFSKLEREKSLELSTSTLARLRSTN